MAVELLIRSAGAESAHPDENAVAADDGIPALAHGSFHPDPHRGVTDDGAPPLSATNSFKVTVASQAVASPPVIKSLSISNDVALLTWTTVSGRSYRMQYKADLTDSNWTGIAPDIKAKIFSPFCTTKPRGMGLGLPIVKRTVFDHHGRVEVDSTPKGTQVSVLLPAATTAD